MWRERTSVEEENQCVEGEDPCVEGEDQCGGMKPVCGRRGNNMMRNKMQTFFVLCNTLHNAFMYK